MLPGDHQQVHGAGRLQRLPAVPGQARAIAQHQGNQLCLTTLGIHTRQALAQPVAPGTLGRRQPFPGLDVTGGADTPGQQGSLAIRAMRIEQAMRTLEGDRQPPALATVHLRSVKPAQLHALRQLRTARLSGIEFESN
ncbi:hypothetical protein D3C78_747550 [compost metagenome]